MQIKKDQENSSIQNKNLLDKSKIKIKVKDESKKNFITTYASSSKITKGIYQRRI